MSSGSRFRPLRGAIGNAVVWGAAWFAGGFVVCNVLRLVGAVPPSISVLDALGMSIRIGIFGAIASFAFAGVIRLVYRGRRLRDISWVRFGFAGAIVAGVFAPLFMQSMNLLTGGGLVPWGLIDGDIVMATVLGGVAAAGSMRLAQWADAIGPGAERDALEDARPLDRIAAARERQAR